MRRDPPDEEGLTSYRRGRPFTLYLQGEGGRSCNPTHRCRNLSSPNDPKPRSFYRSIQLPDDGLLPPLHLLPLNSHPAGNLTLRPRTWGRTQHGFLARLGSSKTSWTKPTKNPKEGLAFVCMTIADLPSPLPRPYIWCLCESPGAWDIRSEVSEPYPCLPGPTFPFFSLSLTSRALLTTSITCHWSKDSLYKQSRCCSRNGRDL
jgi:hypothetical protein